MIQLIQGETDAYQWFRDRRSMLSTESGGGRSEIVRAIIDGVRLRGDAALAEYACRFGDPEPQIISSDANDAVALASQRLSTERIRVMQFAYENIRRFAESIMGTVHDITTPFPGYRAGMRFQPVQKVACYVPGGRYPLPSSALMTATTAKVAGVEEVYIVSPTLSDEILYAGKLAGVKGFIRCGGAQAAAAVAFGTQSIPKMDMLVGPGNGYVTEAKRQLVGAIGIDMLAGPSEVTIIADETATPNWLTWDILSQAEHDPDARCYLITTDPQLARSVQELLTRAVTAENLLPPFIAQSIASSAIFVVPTLQAAAALANAIAPEHLAVATSEPELLRPKLRNYGALFVGQQATVPYGDYVAGPNHTLPTGGTARFSGGLTPLTFLRAQTWLEVTTPCTVLAEETASFARIEGLNAHAQSALVRMSEAKVTTATTKK